MLKTAKTWVSEIVLNNTVFKKNAVTLLGVIVPSNDEDDYDAYCPTGLWVVFFPCKD